MQSTRPLLSSAASVYLIILLAVLTAFDSMAIDMYLPAFPAIQQALGSTTEAMQSSLSVFLIGLALGQAAFGPLIDRYGRRLPLLIGIALFIAGSAWLALTNDSTSFIAARFLQGLGGAAGLVIPRAIVSDLYDSGESAKIFSILMQIMALSPVAAPPLGGLLLKYFNWQAIFWSLVVIGVLTLIATLRLVPETQSREARIPLSPGNIMRSYFGLLRNRRYFWLTLSSSLIMGSLFSYIGGSAFVFMEFFQLSATTYSLIFAVIAVGMIAFGHLNLVLLRRMPHYRVLPFGLLSHFFCALLLLICVLGGLQHVAVIGALLLLTMSSLSLIFGNITAAAMFSAPPEQSGLASACLGVVQYVVAGLAALLLGALHDGSLRPLALTIAGCAFTALLSWRIAVPRPVPGKAQESSR